MSDLTAKYVRERLDYDPISGALTWRPKPETSRVNLAWNTRFSGKPAGGRNRKGYIAVVIDGSAYLGHRLAWLHANGEWPAGEIDHRDRIGHHNWLDNLRPADNAQNGANRKIPDCNTSGVKGVSFDRRRNKWAAQIGVNNRKIFLGRYASKADAASAYAEAARVHFGEFWTTGVSQNG